MNFLGQLTGRFIVGKTFFSFKVTLGAEGVRYHLQALRFPILQLLFVIFCGFLYRYTGILLALHRQVSATFTAFDSGG